MNSKKIKAENKKMFGSGSLGGANTEKPLLEHKQLPVFPNCPGCKNAYLQSLDGGIPSKQFFTVFLLVLCSCKYHACFASLFPSPILSPFSPSLSPFLLHSTRLLHCNC